MKKLLLSAVLACSFGAAHAQFGDLLKKAKDQANGALGSKAGGATAGATPSAGDLIQPDACISNVQGICDIIVGTYYREYSGNPKAYLQKDGGLWFARKDFEVARFYYTGGQQGYKSMGRQCDQGPATADPRYKELKAKLDAAEARVLEMEKAKGIAFVEVRGENNVIFKNTKTGKEYSAGECNHL